MLEKIYKKSEVWFAVVFIFVYVIGNSFLLLSSRTNCFKEYYPLYDYTLNVKCAWYFFQ